MFLEIFLEDLFENVDKEQKTLFLRTSLPSRSYKTSLKILPGLVCPHLYHWRHLQESLPPLALLENAEWWTKQCGVESTRLHCEIRSQYLSLEGYGRRDMASSCMHPFYKKKHMKTLLIIKIHNQLASL